MELFMFIMSFVSINAARIDAGLQPVHWDSQLASYAESHAEVMASAGALFHSDDLSTLLPGRTWLGENVGVCWSCGDVPVQAYLDSPPHREILLSPRATHFGTAEVSSGGDTFDVQIFSEQPTFTLPRYAVLYEGTNDE